MENDRIVKRVHVLCSLGSHLVSLPRKRWIDIMNGCLKKRRFNVEQASRMVYDRNEWREFVKGNPLCIALGMNP